MKDATYSNEMEMFWSNAETMWLELKEYTINKKSRKRWVW